MVAGKKSAGYQLFTVWNFISLGLLSFICIYPFWYILIYSLSDSRFVAQASFCCPRFTFYNYVKVFALRGLPHALLYPSDEPCSEPFWPYSPVTLLGYLFSKPQMPYRAFLYRMLIVTMYVSGGLIPTYLLYTKV